jgi:hypothetical protein
VITTAADDALWSGSLVEGPLKGYHHEAYAVRLGPESPLRASFERLKLREPRPGVFWFDQRCFRSEDDLLRVLKGAVPRIPEAVRVEGCPSVHSFIEGHTLGSLGRKGEPVGDRHVRQIVDLFGAVVGFDLGRLEGLPRDCVGGDHPRSGDSTGFLGRLVDHTITKVYEDRCPVFGDLFTSLGVSGEALAIFRKNVGSLTSRPFSLLHGDLHRENFIIDRAGDLWVIDWELARVGDPVYDLATHLYLMRYSTEQANEVVKRWRDVVESARQGASEGYEDDLRRYLDYKRLQSVYTDVIRSATGLFEKTGPRLVTLAHASEVTLRVLTGARELLQLTRVPPRAEIMSALGQWRRRARDEVLAA